MSKKSRLITESILKRNQNELVHNFIREFATACKKVSIYGPGHPISLKAIDKPLTVLQSFFHYKKYVNIRVQKGNLYVLNICVKESVFSSQIIQYLQLLDISSILLDRDLNKNEFTLFVENLVKRDNLYDSKFNLADLFDEKNISSILVNSEYGYKFFNENKQYHGEFHGEFTLRRLALDQLGNEFVKLALLYDCDEQQRLNMYVDFDEDILKHLIPEAVASFDHHAIRTILSNMVERLKDSMVSHEQKAEISNEYINCFKIVVFHPEREAITSGLENIVEEKSDDTVELEKGSSTGQIKIDSTNKVNRCMDALFVGGEDSSVDEFIDAFHRLLATGQAEQADELICRLLDLLCAPEPLLRQKSLEVLLSMVASLEIETRMSTFKTIIEQISLRISEKRETYEYSELIWKLFNRALENKQYENLLILLNSMKNRREHKDNVTVYDSMAVKKIYEQIDSSDTIDVLVKSLIIAKHNEAVQLRNILIAIGSEQVALALSEIISHPERSVRQQTLKILAELGKSSLTVFTDIIKNDSYFVREEDRLELPDNLWHIVRNSIFVLGSLDDSDAVSALKARISDPDIRVRREVVSSLEKIGGEDALDCLIYLAEDSVSSIREAAIIGIGLNGTEDIVPVLIDLLKRSGREVTRVIHALGKIGGEEAKNYLCSLLENQQSIIEITDGRISKEELQISIVKALGLIGDSEAIEHIKKLKESLSGSKLFFKKSPVDKVITEVLSQR